jgi:hypothetical protein
MTQLEEMEKLKGAMQQWLDERGLFLGSKYGAIQPGTKLYIGSKIYLLCPDCGQLVRLNKPLIGSLHLCNP